MYGSIGIHELAYTWEVACFGVLITIRPLAFSVLHWGPCIFRQMKALTLSHILSLIKQRQAPSRRVLSVV